MLRTFHDSVETSLVFGLLPILNPSSVKVTFNGDLFTSTLIFPIPFQLQCPVFEDLRKRALPFICLDQIQKSFGARI